jgi:hypothetical protein
MLDVICNGASFYANATTVNENPGLTYVLLFLLLMLLHAPATTTTTTITITTATPPHHHHQAMVSILTEPQHQALQWVLHSLPTPTASPNTKPVIRQRIR